MTASILDRYLSWMSPVSPTFPEVGNLIVSTSALAAGLARPVVHKAFVGAMACWSTFGTSSSDYSVIMCGDNTMGIFKQDAFEEISG